MPADEKNKTGNLSKPKEGEHSPKGSPFPKKTLIGALTLVGLVLILCISGNCPCVIKSKLFGFEIGSCRNTSQEGIPRMNETLHSIELENATLKAAVNHLNKSVSEYQIILSGDLESGTVKTKPIQGYKLFNATLTQQLNALIKAAQEQEELTWCIEEKIILIQPILEGQPKESGKECKKSDI